MNGIMVTTRPSLSLSYFLLFMMEMQMNLMRLQTEVILVWVSNGSGRFASPLMWLKLLCSCTFQPILPMGLFGRSCIQCLLGQAEIVGWCWCCYHASGWSWMLCQFLKFVCIFIEYFLASSMSFPMSFLSNSSYLMSIIAFSLS